MENIDEEKLYIYKQVCQCTTQCLKISDTENIKYILDNEASICNKIVLDNINSNISRKIINKSLKYLLDNNYLKAIGLDDKIHKYYLTLDDTLTKLTWENIKLIKKKSIKELLWLFRKLVVDNLLKIIIDEHSRQEININEGIISSDFKNMKVYSVGSTEISSDYDITLYSNNNNALSIVIEDFQTRFISIFGEHSSIVFDTNIYGKAYIIFNCDEKCKNNYISVNLEKCKIQKEKFYYLKSLNDEKIDNKEGKYKYTQVIWSLIKYMRDLKTSLGETIHNKYFDFLKNNIDTKILDIALESLIYLKNTNNTYCDLIKYENEYLDNYNNFSRLLFDNDYISLINFYGTETYFTRGAFLDTVINSQMCLGNLNTYIKENININTNDIVKDFIKKIPIKLNQEDYIASILENAGFFFIHNDKTKYLKRIKDSILILANIDDMYMEIIKSIYFKDLLNITSDNYDYCNWIDNNDFDILKCEKYEMFQVIFKIVYRILKIYIKTIDFVGFPFYTIFIQGHIRLPTEKDVIPKFALESPISRDIGFFRDNKYKSTIARSRGNTYIKEPLKKEQLKKEQLNIITKNIN